jgi:acetyltransferase-like isoleucine patch superfamily enzyme
MKAMREVGFSRIAWFLWESLLLSILRRTWVPPFRALFLRACGATVGASTVIHRLSLTNVDRGGFRALHIGNNCFIGDDVLIDLAAPVTLGDHVTVAARAVVLTHLNVGYKDHPLQTRFPPVTAAVIVGPGSFIGASATVLAGTIIGPGAFIAAGSLVNRPVAAGETVGGVPIRTLGLANQSMDAGRAAVTPTGQSEPAS